MSDRISGLSDAQFAALNSEALATVISKPFAQATWNIRPISQFAAIPATSVGMLYLLIFTYLCVPVCPREPSTVLPKSSSCAKGG